MDPNLKSRLKIGVSFVVIAGFTAIWVWIALDVWQFKPTDAKPKVEIDAVVSSLAGLLSTSVATATAAMLGFEVKTQLEVQQRWWEIVKRVLRRAFTIPGLLMLGCIAYVAIGTLVVVVYLTNRSEAPETVSAFYLSAVGWALGAFSATFKDPPTPYGGTPGSAAVPPSSAAPHE
jgi:hypothetical protein